MKSNSMASAWAASAVLLAGLANGAPTSAAAPTVTIDAGVVVGSATTVPGGAAAVNQYLGIPFAAPPVRFSPPQKPKPWTQPFNASAFGPACHQQFNYPEASREFEIAFFNTPPPPAGESEDCLNINVWVPATPGPSTGRTVMFWIYGGSFILGANSLDTYNGASFAANQDVIIVSPNYRTNVFGFPMAPELPLAQRNLGFLDQRLALDWVQRNIAAFGGDPTKVTIFGESAGAASVDGLIETMPSNPPFRGAIMESGTSDIGQNLQPNNTASWDALVSGLNCTTAKDVLACVRAADALTIVSIEEHQGLAFGPTSDNVTWLEFGELARKNGKIAKVPIFAGTNAQEGRIFTIGQTNVTAAVQAYFPGQTALQNAIIAAYPLGSPGLSSNYEIIAQILTDFGFQCPCARQVNDSLAIGVPSWRYLYNATFPNTALEPGLGVYHGSEMRLVFGTYSSTNVTASEIALSQYMQRAWATFAKSPSTGPGWAQGPPVGVLGTPGAALEVTQPEWPIDARCALYAGVYAAEND